LIGAHKIVFGFFLLCGIAGVANAQDTGCATSKMVVDACFTVHGRLSVYADMRLYLWPVGTHRILGIGWSGTEGEAYPPLPPYVEAPFQKYGIDKTELFGDFRVCPFSADEPHVMREVCIDSASNLNLHLRDDKPSR
jgi:hypothetical protein